MAWWGLDWIRSRPHCLLKFYSPIFIYLIVTLTTIDRSIDRLISGLAQILQSTTSSSSSMARQPASQPAEALQGKDLLISIQFECTPIAGYLATHFTLVAFILYSDGNTRFTVKVDITYSRPVSPQSINCCNCGSRVHHHHQPIIIMATLVFRSVTGGGPQARPTIRFFSVQVQSTSGPATDPVICDYHSHPSFSSVTIPLWQSFFRGQSPPVGLAGHLLISIMLSAVDFQH